jgi:type I restriction enzyme S subunit
MNAKQAKYPQLRFKGCTDPWKQRKLGELGKIYTGNTPKTSDLDNWTDNKEGHIWITPTDIDKLIMSDSDRHLSEKGWFKARKIPENSVLITSIASIGKNAINAVPVAFNQQINAIVPEKNDSYFILSAMIKDTARFASVAGQTATAIINKTTFEKFQIATPSYEEQQKIGAFFQKLDNLITLHQRKLAKLKKLKQGYLQKLFPKNGSKFPQLRFAGFADAWEERKFKDNIVSIQTGTNLLGSAVNEGTPLIKMGNLQRGYFSFKKLEYLDSNSNVGSEDIVNYGDFLFNTRNTLELVGKGATWTGISGKYAFNSNIARFKFDGIDTIFFNYLYNTQQVISQVHARAVGTTSVSAVYPRDLNSLLYYLPSIEEQQKIGSFFKHLDDTIALHQRKLDLLKEQKKGFLQNMFV